MSIRSLLALGLLAAKPIMAIPNCNPQTVTVTKTVTASSSHSSSSSHSTSHSSSTSHGASTSSIHSSSVSSAHSSSITSAPVEPTTMDPAPSTTLTATATGKGLNDYAKAVGKLYMGTAADIPGTPETTDPYYLAEFNNAADWGGATPANAMKVIFQ